jgi:hypothetical protein
MKKVSDGSQLIGAAAIDPNADPHVEDEEPEIIESRISKKLSDRTTKIVIILVLLMLFA